MTTCVSKRCPENLEYCPEISEHELVSYETFNRTEKKLFYGRCLTEQAQHFYALKSIVRTFCSKLHTCGT